MSLTKQIGILLTLLLLILLGSVLGVYFVKSKSFYEAKLSANAQEIARTLSLAIRDDIGDLNRTKAVVDAAFSNGLYEKIALMDMKSGKPLYIRQKRETVTDVPRWFVETFHLHPVTVQRIIETDRNGVLKLDIVTDQSGFYTQMYELFLYAVGLYAVALLLGFAFLTMILRTSLRTPLEKIRRQAEGITQNRFVTQKEIPSTPELKEVVLAMNSMVKRVKELYKRSSEAMKQSQEMLYLDPTTGLHNRRYFQLKLPEYLIAADTRSRGTIMMIRIKGLIEGNRSVGRKKMDKYLEAFARELEKALSSVHEPILCRINGSEFALVLPLYNSFRTQELAREIVSRNLVLSEEFGLEKIVVLSIGICEYERKMQPSKVLGCADSALSEAAMYSESHISTIESGKKERPVAGKEEWRALITEALKQGRFVPRLLPIHDMKRNREIVQVVTFDIAGKEKTIRYGDYIPAVVELGLEHEMMAYAFDFMKRHDFKNEAIAFEMIADMLHQSDKLFLFEKEIREITENLGKPLFVEISEHDILALEPIVVEQVSIALKKYNARLAINRFSGERGEFSHLKYSAPAYVKMSERSFLDLDTASKNALLTLLGSLDIRLVIVDVHGENIPELTENAVRYIMFAER